MAAGDADRVYLRAAQDLLLNLHDSVPARIVDAGDALALLDVLRDHVAALEIAGRALEIAGAPRSGAALDVEPAPAWIVRGLDDDERATLAGALREYAAMVADNLADDDDDERTEWPVVDDYLADADRIAAGETPLHAHSWEVLSDVDAAPSIADEPARIVDLTRRLDAAGRTVRATDSGWTVYSAAGEVLGWIRRGADDEYTSRPAGCYWPIPRAGYAAPFAGAAPSCSTIGAAAAALVEIAR